MKTNKKKEEFELAEVMFEMGMDYEVIEKISGITAQELLLKKINMIDFIDEKSHNLMATSDKQEKNK